MSYELLVMSCMLWVVCCGLYVVVNEKIKTYDL